MLHLTPSVHSAMDAPFLMELFAKKMKYVQNNIVVSEGATTMSCTFKYKSSGDF